MRPVTDDHGTVSWRPSNPTQSKCRLVGLVGASLSDFRRGAKEQLTRQLMARNQGFLLNASDGRGVFEPGDGSGKRLGTGEQAVRALERSGADCLVLTIGTNDAARTGGLSAENRRRIEAVMAAAGKMRVLWMIPLTLSEKGAYAERNMAAFRSELLSAATRHANLRTATWSWAPTGVPRDEFWSQDRVHMRPAGQTAYARQVMEALDQL